MKDTTRPKAAASMAGLPSFHQFVTLAIAKAEFDLEHICRIRCTDEHWSDEDNEVDNAVDLALDQVRRMKCLQFEQFDQFIGEWFKVSAVLHLGVKSFSRKDCAYMRFLDGSCHMFSHAAEMAEFILQG
ncbi:hypothetical protein [Simplicispira piscis]